MKPTGRKEKKFETRIPSYYRSQRVDLMIWTYVHAYRSLFKLNIMKAINLFIDDFGLVDDLDSMVAMDVYQRMKDKFLQDSKLMYDDCEMCTVYKAQGVDVMVYGWVNFYKRRMPNYDLEQAVMAMSEYFDLVLTVDELSALIDRYKHLEVLSDIALPIVPKSFYMN